jgi:hypothetical protein
MTELLNLVDVEFAASRSFSDFRIIVKRGSGKSTVMSKILGEIFLPFLFAERMAGECIINPSFEVEALAKLRKTRVPGKCGYPKISP